MSLKKFSNLKSLLILSAIAALVLVQIACKAVTGGGKSDSTEQPVVTVIVTAEPVETKEAPASETSEAPVSEGTSEAGPTEASSTQSGACPFPELPEAQPSGLINQVTMALNVQGDDKQPADPTTEFKPTDGFHAVTAVTDVPANTVFKAVWYAEDTNGAAECNTYIDETEITTEGTRNIDFTLTPTSAWPVGRYRVELYVDGALDQYVAFYVK